MFLTYDTNVYLNVFKLYDPPAAIPDANQF